MPVPKDLKVGDRAPAFTLPDQDGRKVSLESYRGTNSVVLFFYPGDMTPGCTMQLCAVRDDWSKFRKRGAVVFGVNHGDAASHAAFVNKHTFPFPLLVDRGKKVSAAYGAIRDIFKVKVIRRTVVVVGKDGRVVFLKRGMPKDADILKSL